jgi:hypothetical protein
MIGLSSIPKLISVTNTLTTVGENIVVPGVEGKYICVTRYKLRTVETAGFQVIAMDDSGGNEIDTDWLQAPTNGVFGTNESTPAPSYLFATARGGDLVLRLSDNRGVVYSITYYESEIRS